MPLTIWNFVGLKSDNGCKPTVTWPAKIATRHMYVSFVTNVNTRAQLFKASLALQAR